MHAPFIDSLAQWRGGPKFSTALAPHSWKVVIQWEKKKKVMEIIHRAATALLLRCAVLQISTALPRIPFFSPRCLITSFAAPLRQAVYSDIFINSVLLLATPCCCFTFMVLCRRFFVVQGNVMQKIGVWTERYTDWATRIEKLRTW